MIRSIRTPNDLPQPGVIRLSALTPLDGAAREALDAAMRARRQVRARAELFGEGREIAGPLLIMRGWAARVRVLPDGRRQFINFLLPGDLIGMGDHPHPVAVSTVVALTELVHCPAPPPDSAPALARAYAISRALDESYLLANIVRLGRLNAQERIADLMLELHERLSLAGLVERGGFELPLTQEMLADALGLTAVHVNRMVQTMRRESELSWLSGRVVLTDPAALARTLGRAATRVSAEAA